MATVFFFELRAPWKPVVKAEAEIKTKKQSWVVLSNGRRKLLGSSAFFTEGAANRSRLGLLVQISKNSYLRNWHNNFWLKCKESLNVRPAKK